MRRKPEFDPAWSASWHGDSLALPGGGQLALSRGRLTSPLTVRYRTGGEKIRPRGDRHTRELRDLFQQGGVPPWVRPRMPLICDHDQLVAVADKWLTDEGETRFAESGGMPVWHRDD
jgi:tRNA(Ile)-lysidine synthase